MPICATQARTSFSPIRLSTASKRTALPLASDSVIGDDEIPARVNSVISICGKARRIESASTQGMPSSAATTRGNSECIPPFSMGSTAMPLAAQLQLEGAQDLLGLPAVRELLHDRRRRT